MPFSRCIVLLLLAALPGLLWLTPQGKLWDRWLFLRINHARGRGLYLLFQGLWPLGTSFFLIVLLPVLGFIAWRFTLFLGTGLLVTAGVERFIKWVVRRPRPFQEMRVAVMRQKRRPHDSSFPSGDAVRVAFLATGMVMGLPVSHLVIVILYALALGVAVGRVFLGVHYPTDAWSGIVLGGITACAWFQLYPFWLHRLPGG